MKPCLMPLEFLHGQVIVVLRVVPFAHPFSDFCAEHMIWKQNQRDGRRADQRGDLSCRCFGGGQIIQSERHASQKHEAENSF